MPLSELEQSEIDKRLSYADQLVGAWLIDQQNQGVEDVTLTDLDFFRDGVMYALKNPMQ